MIQLAALGETPTQMRLRMGPAAYDAMVRRQEADLAKAKITWVGWLGIGMMATSAGIIVLRRRRG